MKTIQTYSSFERSCISVNSELIKSSHKNPKITKYKNIISVNFIKNSIITPIGLNALYLLNHV